MSGKIIFTLLKKDLKGCLTNKNILVSFLIPIVFCFIYQNVEYSGELSYSHCILLYLPECFQRPGG